jgi:hypothetical protein
MPDSAQRRSSSTRLASQTTKSNPKNQQRKQFNGAKNTGTKVLLAGEDPIVGSAPTISQRIIDLFSSSTPPCAQPPPTRPNSPRAGSFDGDRPHIIHQISWTSDSQIGRREKGKKGKGKELLLGPTYLRDQAKIVGARELVSPSRRKENSTISRVSVKQRKGWFGIGIKRCGDDLTIQDGGLGSKKPEGEGISFSKVNDGFVFVEKNEWENGCESGLGKLDRQSRAEEDEGYDEEDTMYRPRFLKTICMNNSSDVIHTDGAKLMCPIVKSESGNRYILEDDLNEAMRSAMPRLPRPPRIRRFPYMISSFSLPDPRKCIDLDYDAFLPSLFNRFDSNSTSSRNSGYGSPKEHTIETGCSKSPGMDSFPRVDKYLRPRKTSISNSVDEGSWKHPHNSPVDEVRISEKFLALEKKQNTYASMEDSIEMVLEEYLARSMVSEFSEPYPHGDEEVQNPRTFAKNFDNTSRGSSSTSSEQLRAQESAQLLSSQTLHRSSIPKPILRIRILDKIVQLEYQDLADSQVLNIQI